MFEIVQFEFSRRYGLRNTLTGNILCKKNGDPWMYRRPSGAARRAKKINRRLTKTVRALQSN